MYVMHPAFYVICRVRRRIMCTLCLHISASCTTYDEQREYPKYAYLTMMEKTMKKGQIIEGIVQRVDFPNKGIVETDDGVCVVKNALPGQQVQCAVNKVRHGKAEGRLLQVLAPSALECGSPCPHFGDCGGCTYLSFPYEEQLKIKEAQVKKLLGDVLCKLSGIAENTQDENTSDRDIFCVVVTSATSISPVLAALRTSRCRK